MAQRIDTTYRPRTKNNIRIEIVLITMNSILMSMALGGIWGTVTAIASGLGTFAFAGTILGAIVGLLLSPAFVYCGIRSGIFLSALIIGPVNLLVVIVAAAIGGEAGPLLAMVTSVIVYICLSVYIGNFRIRYKNDILIGACTRCGYAYLRDELAITCPDCGDPRPSDLPDPACIACGYSLTGLISGTCPECGTSITNPSPRGGGVPPPSS